MIRLDMFRWHFVADDLFERALERLGAFVCAKFFCLFDEPFGLRLLVLRFSLCPFCQGHAL